MSGWSIEHEHGNLDAIFLKLSMMRGVSGDKKAGRLPMRDDEGPAKNPLPGRQRNAQQDTKTQWSLLVFRCLGAKELD